MWISKQEYNDLQVNCDDCIYKKIVEDIASGSDYKSDTLKLMKQGVVAMSSDAFNRQCEHILELEQQNADLRTELDTYKRKYADEFQKRFDLIDRMNKV